MAIFSRPQLAASPAIEDAVVIGLTDEELEADEGVGEVGTRSRKDGLRFVTMGLRMSLWSRLTCRSSSSEVA